MKPVPFLDAIAWAKSRKVVLPETYYGTLQGLARAMSFSIAGVSKLDQLQGVMDSLTQATADGQSFATWKARVQSGEISLDLPEHRLENIFRTNIQGHYARGRCEQQMANTDNRPWFLYDAVNDSRTRPSHAAMDGFVARYDDPIWKNWTPPCGYQSLLPDQEIIGSVEIGLKALYSGPAVEIRGKSGYRIRVTAQHPVLTDRGWVDAGCLRKGDRLACYRGNVGIIDSAVAADGQKQYPPSSAQEVFRALASGGVVAVPTSAFDLNGDIKFIDGDVDVVTANSALMGALQSGIDELLQNLSLHAASKKRSLLSRFRSCLTHFLSGLRVFPALAGNLASSHTVPSDLVCSLRDESLSGSIWFDPLRLQISGQPFSVDMVHGREPPQGFASLVKRDHLFRDGAAKSSAWLPGVDGCKEDGLFRFGSLDSGIRDVFVGGFGINPNTFRDLGNAHPGLIETDDVVEVILFDYSGHVYDFQCANGLIIAHGGVHSYHPILSNCRCRRIALTDAQVEQYRQADAKRQKDPALASARQDAMANGPDPGWDYSVCDEPTEGVRQAVEQRAKPHGGRPDRGVVAHQPGMSSALVDLQDAMADPPPLTLRRAWPSDFPMADIHASKAALLTHPSYGAAKSGNVGAAMQVVDDLLNQKAANSISTYLDQAPILVPVYGMEGGSANVISPVFAVALSEQLDISVSAEIVQISQAAPTEWQQFLRPALFRGEVKDGGNYILIVDHLELGGEVAALRGYIEAKGGHVLHVQALAGDRSAAQLVPQKNTLAALSKRHGDIEP